MKTYFRVLAILSLLALAAAVVILIILIPRYTGVELAAYIASLVIVILIGPAEALLLLHVSNLTDEVEELKEQMEDNNMLILKGNAEFSYFKAFELKDNLGTLIDGRPLVEGMTGIITDEDDAIYKGTIFMNDKKEKIAFNKKEKRIQVFECLKALEEVKMPNGKIIKINKVGQIISKTPDDEYVVEFEFEDGSKSEIVIQESKVYK